MGRRRVGILTAEGDLHALVVKQALEDRLSAECFIIEVDRVAETAGVSWSTLDCFPAVLPTSGGEPVEVRTLDVIWWRRFNASVRIPPEITDAAHVELISNDCRAALMGLLLTEFRGAWVSDPHATLRADNKLVQLQVAQAAGFRVPRTLVSQDPDRIRRFCAQLDNQVVVKAVRGTLVRTPLTVMLDERLLQAEDSMRMCPTMYQEYIPGTNHVRAHVFGEAVYSALIESPAVDWRPDLNVPVRVVDLPAHVEERLRRVLASLGLRMGIVDLKLTDDGEPVWLEVNPQGQFLFVEGLCGLPLIAAFSSFLDAEAKRVAQAESTRTAQSGAPPTSGT